MMKNSICRTNDMKKRPEEKKNRTYLDQIACFFRQRLDEIAEQLGSKYTLLVHVTMVSTYWGRCWLDERIIELSHPLSAILR